MSVKVIEGIGMGVSKWSKEKEIKWVSDDWVCEWDIGSESDKRGEEDLVIDEWFI